MKGTVLLALGSLLAFPLAGGAETWKNVSVIDTQCLSKVKAAPDKHTKGCALQCAKGGYGLLTAEGVYLTFDENGNKKTVEALKATEKTDHLRATVVGQRKNDTVRVESIQIE
jgi:hypothetical protein